MRLTRFGYEVTGLPVDGRLHLKSAVTAVADDLLIVDPASIDPRSFDGLRWIETAPDEGHAANVLRIGATVICARRCARHAATTRGRRSDGDRPSAAAELGESRGRADLLQSDLPSPEEGLDDRARVQLYSFRVARSLYVGLEAVVSGFRVRSPNPQRNHDQEIRVAAYVIAHVDVRDPVRYEDYRKMVTPTLTAYGGRFIARGGAVTILEGDWRPKRLVIVEFPSVEQAQAWWNSPEYAPAKALRQATSVGSLRDPGGRAAARVMLPETSSTTELLDVLARYWGFNAFRPLQREAMDAILGGRDSLVVLPTGGGKSLCFQAPALVRPGPRGRRLAAHLADEGSGGHAGRQRRAGRVLQQRALGRRARVGAGRHARGALPAALRVAGTARGRRVGRVRRKAGARRTSAS